MEFVVSLCFGGITGSVCMFVIELKCEFMIILKKMWVCCGSEIEIASEK